MTALTDAQLTEELSVTACAVSVTTALDALDIAMHKMNGLKWGALGLGNDQAFEEYERLEEAFKRAHASLSASLEK